MRVNRPVNVQRTPLAVAVGQVVGIAVVVGRQQVGVAVLDGIVGQPTTP